MYTMVRWVVEFLTGVSKISYSFASRKGPGGARGLSAGRPAILSQSQVLKDYFVSNTAQGNGNYILRQSSPWG